MPLITGWVLESADPAVGPVTTGATGGVVSTVKTFGVNGLVLPAASVAAAVIVCGPLAMARDGVQLQVPPALTTAVHSVAPPSFTVTVERGSAVPLITGLLLLTLVPLIGDVNTGATGATVSTVTVTGGEVNGPT